MTSDNIWHTKARAKKLDFNLLLTHYALERMLCRLSILPQSDQFLLKGACQVDISFGDAAGWKKSLNESPNDRFLP